MLVLRLNPSDSIIATLEDGREIDFTVVKLRGDRVVVGITADRNIDIKRQQAVKSDSLRTEEVDCDRKHHASVAQ